MAPVSLTAEAVREDYISKQEVLDGIRESLMEIREARREGRELPDIKVLLNELRS